MNKNPKFANSRKGFVILFLILSIMFYAGWNLTGKLIYSEIIDLRKQIKQINREKDQLTLIITQREEIEVEWTRWQEKKELLDKIVPIKEDLPFVLVNLEKYINHLPGTVHNYQVGETTSQQNYIETRINLSISDQAHRIHALLEQIEKLPYLLIIDSVSWSQAVGEEVRLDLVLQLILFNPLTVETANEMLITVPGISND